MIFFNPSSFSSSNSLTLNGNIDINGSLVGTSVPANITFCIKSKQTMSLQQTAPSTPLLVIQEDCLVSLTALPGEGVLSFFKNAEIQFRSNEPMFFHKSMAQVTMPTSDIIMELNIFNYMHRVLQQDNYSLTPLNKMSGIRKYEALLKKKSFQQSQNSVAEMHDDIQAFIHSLTQNNFFEKTGIAQSLMHSELEELESSQLIGSICSYLEISDVIL
jgi:hypothetical protein